MIISIISNKIKYVFLSIIAFSFLISCTPQKKMIYLQGTKSTDSVNNIYSNTFVYKIKPRDILYIKIYSLDEKISNLFNIEEKSMNYGLDYGAYLNNYSVNDSGFIDLPIIKKLKVEGLTIEESKDTIQKNLEKYIKDVTVVVKLISFRISMLGEVRKPGTYTIYNTRLNILEALSLAGDLTEYGNRKNIMIIRQNEGNKIYKIDLTNVSLLYSDKFNLLPNDIIYVESLKTKMYGWATFPFATVFSAITTVILIISYIKVK